MRQARTIRCAISPDADDQFMFRAVALDLVEREGLDFDLRSDHTDALNRLAGAGGDLDLAAVSIAWYPRIHRDWQLMPNGGSVGRGYGPVVVAPVPLDPTQLRGRRVAVPGTTTTAHLVLRLFTDFEPVVVPITPPGAVFEALAQGRVDAALLIHEGRLTWADHGLHRVMDIGEWWLHTTGLPLPLGGNVVRRGLGAVTVARVTRVVGASIRHGLDHRDEAISWLMDRGTILKSRADVDHYLSLYANADTLDYGDDGRAAVAELLARGARAGLLPPAPPPDYAGEEANSSVGEAPPC